MALVLPVLHRVATPSDATGAGTPDCECPKPMARALSSSPSASTSASGEMHYSVKNTFIDVSPAGSEEDRAERALHHGARTCLARIDSKDSPQQLLGRRIGVEASSVVFTPTPQYHIGVASPCL